MLSKAGKYLFQTLVFSLYSKQTSPNYETIKRLIKRKTQEKCFQEATASSRETQWHNIKSTG